MKRERNINDKGGIINIFTVVYLLLLRLDMKVYLHR